VNAATLGPIASGRGIGFERSGDRRIRPVASVWLALALLFTMHTSMAAMITISTAVDEKNCNSATCGTNTNVHGKGCSLREAMANVANGDNTSYPECTAPTPAGPNTIDLNNFDVQVNGLVDDPSTTGGTPQIHNGSLEFDANVVDATSRGALTVQNGKISCLTIGSMPRTGGRMFHVNAGGDLTLKNLTIHDCEDNELGIAVRTESGMGSGNNPTSLTINNTTFTNIYSTDGSSGGTINHGDGNLTINDSAFTGCQIDDSQQQSGAHDANGGAISIGSVGDGTLAQIYNTAFTFNTAKTNGGAMELEATDSILLVNTTFTSNKANGNTFNAGNAELGGGAIYASNTENGNQVTSSFLIINSLFTLNSAPDGTGGAILVSNGNLTYGDSLLAAPGAIGLGNGPPTTPPYPTNIPGGIFSTNFLSNSAGGKWNGTPVDTRAGAGGAVYASGKLAVLDSSFISNSSSNGSGGGIGQYGTSSTSRLSAGNSTFSSNTATVNGGAIANLKNSANNFNPTMTLENDTISGNTAGTNGGGAIYNGGDPADVVVSNTILANSSAGGNCAPANGITDLSHNLQYGSGKDCGPGMTEDDPVLDSALPFAGVNFQVAVMKLDAGSAASGAGDPATCTGQPVYNLDAALNLRPQGSPNCDIGAYESGISPDLTITKTHTDPFAQGDVGKDYTITVNNVGSTSSSGTVTVTDTLPAGLTATAFAGTGWTGCTATPVVGPNTLTCTRIDALPATTPYPPITLTVSVAANAPVQVTNMAMVAGGGDASVGNNMASDLTNITAVMPDLTITKSHTDPFAQGQTGDTYTITVANAGNGSTSGAVTVIDNLPAGLTATGFSGTGWTGCTAPPVVGPNPLTCTRSDVLPASTPYPPITLTVSVAANAAVQVTNTAMVSGGGETNLGNDTATDLTNITPVVLVPDLTISKTHMDPFAQGAIGDSYTITVANAGTGQTSGAVTVTDALPAGLAATGFAGTGWNGCTATPVVGPNTLTCTRGDVLASGSSYPPIMLTVDVAANAAAQVTNTASVAGGGESNTGNDSVNDLTNITAVVVPVPDMTITKTHMDPFAQGGTGDTYTITVANGGTGPSSGAVTVSDALPAGLTATGFAGTGWTGCTATPVVGPNALTCTRSDALPNGSTYPPITLTVSVAANAAAQVTNSATVSGGGESNMGNDVVNDPTNITPVVTTVPDLDITKTHSDPFTQGDIGDTYTITVGNSGNASTNSAVTVTDMLPAGLTATGFSGGGWTGCTSTSPPVVGPNTLTCTRSNVLTAGSSYPPVTLTVNVAASAAAQVTNTAMVSGGGESNMGNDLANDLTNISGIPDLTVSATHVGNFSLGQIGDLYTITVHNIGTGPTVGTVTLSNNLPTGLTATAIGGVGWVCSSTSPPVVGPGMLTCTSTDVVPVGSDFPIIALTVNVAVNAPHLLTDSVIVSGGGETNTTNDTANDATTTPVRLQSFEVN
jgi:uncharacterized repeat protein (TIGR01451 family)